jgi:hypothetical protein
MRTHPVMRVLKSPERISVSPVASKTFPAGTRVYVGGRAGNRAYLIAYRAKEPGKPWRKLSCYATVLAENLEGGPLPCP